MIQVLDVFVTAMLIDHYIRIVEAAAENTVCVDFDGVLAQWKPGMSLDAIGTPIPQGMAMTKLLIAKGYTVVILTARPPFMHAQLEKWLAGKGIDAQVTSEKPPALLYIDDRGFRFTGNSGDREEVLALLEKEKT